MKLRTIIILTLGGLISVGWGSKKVIYDSTKLRNMRESVPARVYEINDELLRLRKESIFKDLNQSEIEANVSSHIELVKEIEKIYDSDPNIPQAYLYLKSHSN